MSGIRLYEISDAYRQIEAMLDDETIDETQLLAAIDEVHGELQAKATNIVMFIENLSATADAIKNAETRMATRRKAIENRIEHVKAYVKRCMQGASINKISCPEFTISLRKSPPRVVIDDETAIPISYLRQPEPPPPAPDKKAILADMKLGVVVDGCHMEQGESLVIS